MDQFTPDTTAYDAAAEEAASRSGSRDSLMLTARLSVPGLAQPVQVRVRNLSPGGLMAEYAGPGALGEPVEIEVRGVGRVRGRIAWNTDGRVGIAFDQVIDPLRARKPVGVAARR